MKVLIIGFYGWGNCGDEAILGGISQILMKIDPTIEIEIASDIPHTMHARYIGTNIVSTVSARSIRTLSNFSMEGVDLVILGGGGLTLGYGYGLVTMAVHCNIPIINLGIAIHRNCVSSPIFKEFSAHFNAILPRSGPLSELMTKNGIENIASFCPSVHAPIAEKGDLPKKYVVVTPRRSDADEGQVDVLVQELQKYRGAMPIVLAPFSRCDIDGKPIDLFLCEQIKSHIPESIIVPWSGYEYHKMRCLFQNASLVINTGRYHSALFAAQFGIPLKCSMSPLDMFPGTTSKTQDLFTDLGKGPIKTWKDGFTYIESWDQNKWLDLIEREKQNGITLSNFISQMKENNA
ncbi:MAG: polysaccharide pyruvyl transferase family protein [Candidatus Thorarchaeota archaeon]